MGSPVVSIVKGSVSTALGTNMKLGLLLVLGAVLACGDSAEGGDAWVETTSPSESCDPSLVEDLPPGYARIDGCPGSSPKAVAATWAEYCAAHPEHERCSGACGDAGACPGEDE